MTTLTLRATCSKEPDEIVISSVCLERPELSTYYSIGLKANDHALAARLMAAINAGKAFTNPRITKDNHGDEYIEHDITVIGRHLNSHLKRIGF